MVMKEHLINRKEYSVYPGEFIPLPEEIEMLEKLKISGKEDASKPPINIDEFTDCFKIEVVLPGVRREDIFVQVNKNTLSIVVLHKDCEKNRKKVQIHEFDSKCCERHILLPKGADAEFVSAEFRQGILRLHIPKTNEQQSDVHINQIIVY